ncbi:MAG TPA: twitching motility protein PilT, partial [Chloroflexi bacterium]|nr:twitching motility protein PilT [Chloroflexota bacterium]
MAHRHVLDTHALIWYLEGNPRLGQDAKRVMDDPRSELVLPVIALAEAAFIVE